MTEIGEQIFKPLAVATGLEGDDDFAVKLRVKGAHIILLVVQVVMFDLTTTRLAISDGLLSRVKIYSTIDRHSASFSDLMSSHECNTHG